MLTIGISFQNLVFLNFNGQLIEDLIDHFCLSEKYKSKIVSEWLSATWVCTGISSFLQAYMGSRLVSKQSYRFTYQSVVLLRWKVNLCMT